MSAPKRVAVVTHRKKTLGGGLDELRAAIAGYGAENIDWSEVPKSRKAPKKARRAVERGAELVFVWGGDGMVQRCLDALAGRDATVAIVPAGTANLLANNLGVPEDLGEAVRIGFEGERRRLDLGRINGEHFAVMAGAGFDGRLIRDADRDLKDRAGKLAYVWTGLRHVGGVTPRTRIKVDGTTWFDEPASCVLVGNVGRITGGIHAFDDARPDDGWLEVGVTTAQGAAEWARTLGRMAVGRSERSPFVRMTRARRVDIRLAEPMTYELDGGARGQAKKMRVRVVPAAITVCVPA
ncbi:YegS/Rv2252/BmrU family lipid kinase [Micromonospora sp. Llam0]|uniref:diacylglycerol/lipid kinase family protein n=1 Tax=Micromonospora sp. Llam0 TaxID=2485143 RepID=UPI000F4A1CF1|nr:YegS/Rv2252/BmrU family lipid kinase [Micromonospora sp. Llam0]ROO61371.1 YegS/Rv2252/BmrU family lipid kinase [Micromonospora sp. Llam0]